MRRWGTDIGGGKGGGGKVVHTIGLHNPCNLGDADWSRRIQCLLFWGPEKEMSRMGYNTSVCSGSANAVNSPIPCSIHQVAMNQMGDKIRACRC